MARRAARCCVAVLAAWSAAAHAQSPPAESAAPAEPPFADRLTRDWGGLRTRARDAGFQLDVTYVGEVLGNVTGGVQRGAVYEGRLEMGFEVDLGQALGWSGATFRASAWQIHGRGLSASNLGNNLLVASGIEALPASRLHDLWLQQDLLGGALQIRAGQFDADDEFAISQNGANFINSTFGWPGLFATDLPSGGPAYPLATPGAWLRIRPRERLAIMAAVFNGDPAGPGVGNPQARDASSTAFRLNDDAFAIVEICYAVNQICYPPDEQDGAPALRGTYKLGAWYHSGRFADQRFDGAGRSLADPASTGVAAQHRGNFAIYAAVDQMFWRPDPAPDRGLSAFLRITGSPSDRNLVSFYIDGGLTYKGLIPGRDDDTIGLGVGHARISGAARGFDRDTNAFTGRSGPVRDYEAVIELTYVARMARQLRWLTLQPDFQFIFHPGANAAITTGSMTTARNAAIFGLRSTVSF
jgi:porin